VTVLPSLPRRDGYTPPDWWQPHIAEFPRWRAWHIPVLGTAVPGTMRVCHAAATADLASQIRTADPSALADREPRKR
jgi:hypothetical protein